MTVTWSIYFLGSVYVLWSAIQAYQPDGYLGCFEDINGESLVNLTLIFDNQDNKGDVCKAVCKNNTKRYAGTKYLRCYCGSGVVQNRKRSSTQCNKTCPGNSREACGGYYHDNWTRISVYDTWLCITNPCQNGATCTDIDAESFNCSCSVGWTGRVCNEKVTTTTSTIIPSSSSQAIILLSSTKAIGSSTKAQTVITTTSTIFLSSSAQPTGSSTAAQKVTATTYSTSLSSSRQGIGSSTVVAQQSENKLAIYIAVPVSIVVLIVFVLIVTVLILRKRLSRNKDGRKTVNKNSANTSRSLLAVANNAYHDQHTIPLEDAATSDSDHNYYILEQIGVGNCNYNNANQPKGLAIDNDDNSYGHLHVRPTALFDPTYSHTTKTGPQGTTDNTYSHINLSVGNRNHDVMSNVDKDTYNTCNMKGGEGKTRPAVEINDVDDTYRRLAISGKATNMGKKHMASSLNEPDYDHTDVRNH